MERKTDDQFTSISMLQNLLDEHDIILPLSENQVLLVLKENVTFEKKYHRILSAAADCHMGIWFGGNASEYRLPGRSGKSEAWEGFISR